MFEELSRVFKLPKYLRKLTLTAEVGRIVEVECVFFPERADVGTFDIPAVRQKFELRPVTEPEPLE